MKKIVLTIIALFILEAGLLAQNYALDFDGTNDYVSTPIDADRQAMPSTTWSGWNYVNDNGISERMPWYQNGSVSSLLDNSSN